MVGDHMGILGAMVLPIIFRLFSDFFFAYFILLLFLKYNSRAFEPYFTKCQLVDAPVHTSRQ